MVGSNGWKDLIERKICEPILEEIKKFMDEVKVTKFSFTCSSNLSSLSFLSYEFPHTLDFATSKLVVVLCSKYDVWRFGGFEDIASAC